MSDARRREGEKSRKVAKRSVAERSGAGSGSKRALTGPNGPYLVLTGSSLVLTSPH